MRNFRLYVILDADICDACGNIIEITRQIILGGADILQLRAKNLSDRKTKEIGQAIKNLLRKGESLFVLNDRADLAHIIGADGVHLGQEDLSIKDARKILGNKRIVGLSTHNLQQARAAEKQGADYIGIGPIFATATKPKSTALSPTMIAKIKDKVKIPFVAVGGINLENLGQVLACGAQRVAVCRAIITAKNITVATKEFRRRLYN